MLKVLLSGHRLLWSCRKWTYLWPVLTWAMRSLLSKHHTHACGKEMRVWNDEPICECSTYSLSSLICGWTFVFLSYILIIIEASEFWKWSYFGFYECWRYSWSCILIIKESPQLHYTLSQRSYHKWVLSSQLCGRYKMVQELKCDNMNPFVGALGNQEPVNLGQSQIIG